MFAVTGGLGIEKRDKAFLDNNDDYSSIMLKSIADRLAEGFAECLHARVRRDLWGYVSDESLSNEAILAEKYQGDRKSVVSGTSVSVRVNLGGRRVFQTKRNTTKIKRKKH